MSSKKHNEQYFTDEVRQLAGALAARLEREHLPEYSNEAWALTVHLCANECVLLSRGRERANGAWVNDRSREYIVAILAELEKEKTVTESSVKRMDAFLELRDTFVRQYDYLQSRVSGFENRGDGVLIFQHGMKPDELNSECVVCGGQIEQNDGEKWKCRECDCLMTFLVNSVVVENRMRPLTLIEVQNRRRCPKCNSNRWIVKHKGKNADGSECAVHQCQKCSGVFITTPLEDVKDIVPDAASIRCPRCHSQNIKEGHSGEYPFWRGRCKQCDCVFTIAKPFRVEQEDGVPLTCRECGGEEFQPIRHCDSSRPVSLGLVVRCTQCRREAILDMTKEQLDKLKL